MLQARQVDTDLMGASGADANFQEGISLKAAQHFELAPCRAPFGEPSGHAGAVDRISRYRAFDAAALRLYVTLNQGQVSLDDLATGKLTGEGTVRGVVLGNQQHAAGKSVEAMDDAGAQSTANAGEILEAVEQRIDQGSGMHSCAGMNDHTGRLVDGHKVGILIERGEGDVFGSSIQGRGCGGLNLDDFAAAESVGWPGAGPVHMHITALDPILDAGAAGFRKASVQPVVQALACVQEIYLELIFRLQVR